MMGNALEYIDQLVLVVVMMMMMMMMMCLKVTRRTMPWKTVVGWR